MKKFTLIVALISIATTANAQFWGGKKIQGNGNLVTNNRDLSDYDEVGVAGSFDVILIAGKEGKISVEAEDNLQEYIITEVKGNKLKIYTKDGYNLNTSRNNVITITVPFEDISKVSMAGSGDIIGKDLITADQFECAVAGSGDMVLEVNAKNISASVAGSGDLTLSGKSDKSILKVAGSGDLDASDLNSTDAEASVAGSGDISLNCDGGDLKASVAGSGDIRYSGKPNNVSSKIVGSGSVSN
ncbi:head GIN domain-containing protein [Leeuwenhoekiella sp. NPDC079379]|uniref:head GIN domain-containing protein n=1 Tax=Leeuwenhoekiella sp. NPDC079379 TaxID=3364122 RepID=UPI0037CBC7A7